MGCLSDLAQPYRELLSSLTDTANVAFPGAGSVGAGAWVAQLGRRVAAQRRWLCPCGGTL